MLHHAVYQVKASRTPEACQESWEKQALPPNHPDIAPTLGFPLAVTTTEILTFIVEPRHQLLQTHQSQLDILHWKELAPLSRTQWHWNPDYSPFINTLAYLWHTRGKGTYVALSKKGVALFIPFINPQFQNVASASLLKQYEKARRREKREKLLPDVKQWNTVGCLLANEDPIQVRGGGWGVFLNLFREAAKKLKEPRDFFFHRYDHPQATHTGHEPNYHMTGRFDAPIPGMETFQSHLSQSQNRWYPILGNATGPLYVERPIPTADEWQLATQSYFPPDCHNGYIDALKTIVPWKDRTNQAVWRGGINQCGFNPKTNQRLALVVKGKERTDLMNVGLTGWGTRMKMEFRYRQAPKIGKTPISYLSKHYGIDKASPLTRQEQQAYKYIIDLPGNNENPGYRFAWEMLAGFCILWVGEPFGAPSGEGERRLNLWFWPQLKAWEHYVPVKWDLSDLEERIRWCQAHDEEAKQIAENARSLAEQLFQKKTLIQVVVDALQAEPL